MLNPLPMKASPLLKGASCFLARSALSICVVLALSSEFSNNALAQQRSELELNDGSLNPFAPRYGFDVERTFRISPSVPLNAPFSTLPNRPDGAGLPDWSPPPAGGPIFPVPHGVQMPEPPRCKPCEVLIGRNCYAKSCS